MPSSRKYSGGYLSTEETAQGGTVWQVLIGPTKPNKGKLERHGEVSETRCSLRVVVRWVFDFYALQASGCSLSHLKV